MGTTEDVLMYYHFVISFGFEEVIELVEDELHNLVLKDHVHGDVGLLLRSQQRWAEHDGHTLDRHAVLLTMVNYSERWVNGFSTSTDKTNICDKDAHHTTLKRSKKKRSILSEMFEENLHGVVVG